MHFAYLVSQGLFEKGSGKILLKIECNISMGGGCTRVCCASDTFMSALPPLRAHKEIWCYFRSLGFFIKLRNSLKKSLLKIFLVNLGVLVQRSSTEVLVCVAEPPSHCKADFAAWIHFQVCAHFCYTNDINSCLGRGPQP